MKENATIMTKYPDRQILVFGLPLTILVFIVMVFFSTGNTREANSSASWVAHTHEVLFETEKLLLMATNVETGARAFLLTGLPPFLQTFETSKREVHAEISILRQLTADNPSQQPRLDSLEAVVDQWIVFCDSVVSTKKNIDVATALQIVQKGAGKLYTDRTANLVDRMQQEEARLLKQRKNNNEKAILFQQNFFYCFVGVMLALLFFIFWKERNYAVKKERERSVTMFRNMLESAHDPTIIVNENGRIVFVNNQAESLFNYDKTELAGVKATLLIPDGLQIVQQKQIVECAAVKKGGQTFMAEISLSPLQTASGLVVSAAVRDVTARKAASEVLRKSEEMFRLLVTSVKDYAIFRLDANGLVASWNSGAEHIKGYSADEIIGRPISVFYTPEELECEEPAFNLRMARENGSYQKEGLRVRKNGSQFFADIVFTALFDTAGNLQGYSKVTRDITEKKKAGEQIAYLARLIDSTSDAVLTTNQAFEIKSWNKAAELLYGYRAEEVIGLHVNSVITVALDEASRQKVLQELLRYGYWTGEITHNKKDGTPVFLLASNTVTRDAEGKIDGYMAVCRDISKRVNLEAQLKKSNEELEAFSYSVSHDLRAPLRGIIGFAAMLEEEYANKLDPEAKRIILVIKRNALKMGQLIDDLLHFSRMGRNEIIKSAIDTGSLVHDIIRELDPQQEGIPIEWVIPELPESYADRTTIKQVWINLISNAIKYSRKATKRTIEIGSFTRDAQQVFFVKDNGAGFDQNYAHKLFHVFQRLHGQEEFEGTGIGLAIVEKIVAKHGGKVWAEATLDKGATFYFSLPFKPGTV